MCDSLEQLNVSYKIYILTMDDLCYDILKKINCKNAELIKLHDFVDDEDLYEIYNTRHRNEFCWTCSSHLIHYVLEKRKEKECTYIDADMFFYSNPQIVLDEMQEKSVQIIKHWFSDTIEDKRSKAISGVYCVEFNTFRREEDSINLLLWWMAKCRESCTIQSNSKGVFGDQMYLRNWGELSYVSVVKNRGAGLAPWNITQYKLKSTNEEVESLIERKTGKIIIPVFFHFHNIEYLDRYKVNIGVFERRLCLDKKLVEQIYCPYLELLEKKKMFIEKNFGFVPMTGISSGSKAKANKERNFLDLYIKTIRKIRRMINGKHNIIEIQGVR